MSNSLENKRFILGVRLDGVDNYIDNNTKNPNNKRMEWFQANDRGEFSIENTSEIVDDKTKFGKNAKAQEEPLIDKNSHEGILNQNRKCIKVQKTRSTVYKEVFDKVLEQLDRGLNVELDSFTKEEFGYNKLGWFSKSRASKYLDEIKNVLITGDTNFLHEEYRNQEFMKKVFNLHVRLETRRKEFVATKLNNFVINGNKDSDMRQYINANYKDSVEIRKIEFTRGEGENVIVGGRIEKQEKGTILKSLNGGILTQATKELFDLKYDQELLENFRIFLYRIKNNWQTYNYGDSLEVLLIPKTQKIPKKDPFSYEDCEMKREIRPESMVEIKDERGIEELKKVNFHQYLDRGLDSPGKQENKNYLDQLFRKLRSFV